MNEPKLQSKSKEVTYFKLNNELNRPVNGSIPLGKDKEAVKAYFLEHVNPNTVFFHSLKEKLDYLIENDYIEEDVIVQYKPEFVKELFERVYNFKFRFDSFMGAYKFYTQYALRTNDGERFLERYEDRIAFNALFLARGDEKLAIDLSDELINRRLQPATPTFMNSARKRRGELVSCFLLSTEDDMHSIGRVINSALQLSKRGGGVGINLSNVRSAGDPIKQIENASSGVVPIMKLLEDSFSYSNQLGQRNGAGVTYLSVFHPDIISFLSTKKENADEKIRVKTLSLGVTVPDKFYELARNNENMYLFSPYDVEREYGIGFSYVDITEEYENMVSNPNIRKSKINARELENEISKLQQESGYPYIINIDTANKSNPIDGKILMSNLCVTGDTELLTDEGYVSAKELYDNQKSLNVTIDSRAKELNSESKGSESVKAIPMQLTAKEADVYELTTHQGFTIKSTEWHKYYVKRDREIVKIPMKDIEIGDKVLVQSGEGKTFGSNNDTELAYLMGIVAGDGTLSNSKNGHPSARIILHQDKKQFKDDIENKVSNVIKKYLSKIEFSREANESPIFREKEQNDKIFLIMDSAHLGKVLDYSSFNKDTKTELPTYIKKGTKKVQQAYLSGLFQMDGCVNANLKAKAMTIELVTVSKSFAEDLQKIILNLGVYSTVYKRKKRVTMLPDSNRDLVETNCQATYRISIQDRKAREKFAETVVLKDRDIEKIREFNKILAPVSRNPKHDYTATVTSIEYIGREDVYDTTQEDYHSLIFNGIVTGNCSEILQVQEPSVLNEDQSYETLGTDISCNLGSTNMVNMMGSPNFGKSIEIAVRSLTTVTDMTSIGSVPTVKNGNEKAHTIGLGAMGLHTLFAMNQIEYGSEESLEVVDAYFRAMNYYSIVASNKIAREKNEVFVGFEKSDYATGNYFHQFLNEKNEYEFKSEKVKEMFKNIHIPTSMDWLSLEDEVEAYGLYHQNRLAIAPTGSISYVNETSASLHPITQLIEERQEKKTGKTYYPAPKLSNETLPYYKSAYDIDMRKVIDVYATAQKHIDQGMSMTLFMRSEIPESLYEWKNGRTNKMTTRDLNILRNYSWKKGIKSIYYVRTYTNDDTEIGSNECESCSI